MANEREDAEHSDAQDSADEGADKKLYAGKYRTVEDLERAYEESQRAMHGTNEKFSRLEQKIDTLFEGRDEYGRGRRFAQADDDTRAPSRSNEILREFYTDPEGVLNRVEERAEARFRRNLEKEQAQARKHYERVQAWASKNKDVADHGDILTYWVERTDPKDEIEDRLDAAAAKVRQRVLQLRGKGKTSEPEPKDVVEGPQGGSRDAHGNAPRPAPAKTDAESQLASYVSARNQKVRKPLGGRASDES